VRREEEVLVNIDVLIDTVAAHRSYLVYYSWVVIHCVLFVEEQGIVLQKRLFILNDVYLTFLKISLSGQSCLSFRTLLCFDI
jgi:hypothetical protein